MKLSLSELDRLLAVLKKDTDASLINKINAYRYRLTNP